MAANSFISGDDQKPPSNDATNGWDYSQDRYGYNLPNQFMNDLTTRFYWDQDTHSWKNMPGQASSGLGIPAAKTAKVPQTGLGSNMGYANSMNFGPYGGSGQIVTGGSGGGTLSGAGAGGFKWGDFFGGVGGNVASQFIGGLIGSPGSTSKTDSSMKRTWDQGLAQNQYEWMRPDIDNLMGAAGRAQQDYGQAKALLSQGLGSTDISELKRSYGKLMGQDIYKSYDQGLGTLSDYRNQLSTGTTSADVQAGRQMKEAQRGMSLQPGMTAAQRGAATANMQGQAADSSYGQRLSEYGGATSALAQGQMGRSALESQNIQAAGQLAAQMSGFRAGDLNRYIAGSQLLSQMAMQNPEMAAIYAVLGIKQNIQGQTMGADTKATTKQGGTGLMGKIFG